MITYQTKHKTVKGISADKALSLAKENWSKLPAWFKKKFLDNKILIGGSIVRIDIDGCRYTASESDIIFLDDKDNLRVMKEEDFLDIYEDVWGAKSRK